LEGGDQRGYSVAKISPGGSDLAEETVITDEMRAAIGIQSEPSVIEIEKGMTKRFAQAIEDPSPLWQNEEYARYGGIVAPPGFIMSAGIVGSRMAG
jgi:hypothetical protein